MNDSEKLRLLENKKQSLQFYATTAVSIVVACTIGFAAIFIPLQLTNNIVVSWIIAIAYIAILVLTGSIDSASKTRGWLKDIEDIDNAIYSILEKEDNAENFIKRLYHRK